MTWTYSQSSGELLHDGEFVGTGYSGTGDGRNNPEMEAVHNEGPIPKGGYFINAARKSERLGPLTMNLTPYPETVTFGRDLFRIHGNNKENDASHGCIILGPLIRDAISKSGDTALTVVS